MDKKSVNEKVDDFNRLINEANSILDEALKKAKLMMEEAVKEARLRVEEAEKEAILGVEEAEKEARLRVEDAERLALVAAAAVDGTESEKLYVSDSDVDEGYYSSIMTRRWANRGKKVTPRARVRPNDEGETEVPDNRTLQEKLLATGIDSVLLKSMFPRCFPEDK